MAHALCLNVLWSRNRRINALYFCDKFVVSETKMQNFIEEADVIERIAKSSELFEQVALYKNKNDELKRIIVSLKKKYAAEKSSTSIILNNESNNKLKQSEEECEQLRKEMTILTKKHQEKLQTCQKLNYQNNQLQSEVQKLESKLKDKKDGNVKVENDLKSKTVEIAELKEKIRQLQKKNVEYQQLQSQVEKTEQIIRTKSMKNVEVEKQLIDKSMELDKLREKNKSLEEENSKLNWTCDQLENEVKEMYDKCIREDDMNPKILPLPSFDQLNTETSDEDEPPVLLSKQLPDAITTEDKRVSGLLPPIVQSLVYEAFDDCAQKHIQSHVPELINKLLPNRETETENPVHSNSGEPPLPVLSETSFSLKSTTETPVFVTSTPMLKMVETKVTETAAEKVRAVLLRRQIQRLAKKRSQSRKATIRSARNRVHAKPLQQKRSQHVTDRTSVMFHKRKMIEIDRTSSNQTKIFLQPCDKDIVFVDCDRERPSIYEFRDVTDQFKSIAESQKRLQNQEQQKTPPTSTAELFQEVTSTTPGSKPKKRRTITEESGSGKRARIIETSCLADAQTSIPKQASPKDIRNQNISNKRMCSTTSDEQEQGTGDVIEHVDKSIAVDDDSVQNTKGVKSAKNKAPLSELKKLRRKVISGNLNRKIETESVLSKEMKRKALLVKKLPTAQPIERQIPDLETIKKTLEIDETKQKKTSGFKRSTAKRSQPKTKDSQEPSLQLSDTSLDENKTKTGDGASSSINVIEAIADDAVRCDAINSNNRTDTNLTSVLNIFLSTIDEPSGAEAAKQALKKLSTSRTSDLISVLIKHLEMSEDQELDKTYTPPAPMLTVTEQKMILLVKKLEADNCVGLFNSLLDSIDQSVRKKIQMANLLSLSRFYMGVCKLQKNVVRLRLYLLKVTYYWKNQAIPIWFMVMAQYSEVLPKSEEADNSPIVSVIVHFIKTRNIKSVVYKTQPLQRLLSNYYKYNDERYNAEELLERLLKLYQDDDCAINEFSIALLCKLESLTWVKTQIKKRLVPLSKCCDRFKSLIKRLLLQAGVEDFQFLVQSPTS